MRLPRKADDYLAAPEVFFDVHMRQHASMHTKAVVRAPSAERGKVEGAGAGSGGKLITTLTHAQVEASPIRFKRGCRLCGDQLYHSDDALEMCQCRLCGSSFHVFCLRPTPVREPGPDWPCPDCAPPHSKLAEERPPMCFSHTFRGVD